MHWYFRKEQDFPQMELMPTTLTTIILHTIDKIQEQLRRLREVLSQWVMSGQKMAQLKRIIRYLQESTQKPVKYGLDFTQETPIGYIIPHN